MPSEVVKTGHPVSGISTVRHEGYHYHALPGPYGLAVETDMGLTHIGLDGSRVEYPGIRHSGFRPHKEGIAVQQSERYLLLNYDGAETLLHHNRSCDQMRSCNSGMIVGDPNDSHHFIPFDGSPERVIWTGRGVNTVVDDGMVIHSYDDHNWHHICGATGENQVIYEDPCRPRGWGGEHSGLCGGNVLACFEEGWRQLYAWNGREPATAPHFSGSCREGIVVGYTDGIGLFRFGGKNCAIWEGSSRSYEWHGSTIQGLIIAHDGKLLLLPYDGSAPRLLWEGPFGELLPIWNALLVEDVDRAGVTMLSLAGL